MLFGKWFTGSLQLILLGCRFGRLNISDEILVEKRHIAHKNVQELLVGKQTQVCECDLTHYDLDTPCAVSASDGNVRKTGFQQL